MRIKKLKLRGFKGIFKGVGQDELNLELDGLDGLVILSGANGRGKTTLLENLQPFRTMPSRGISLKDAVYLKDSCKDLVFDHDGSEYRCLVTINGDSGSSAGMMWKDEVALTTGKVKEYDEILLRLFGSQKLFFQSVFCPQNSDSLLSLTPAIRKQFFVEFLGLEKLQEYSESAKGVNKAISNWVDYKTADLENAKSQLVNTEQTKGEILESKDQLEELHKRHKAEKLQIDELSDVITELNKKYAQQNEIRLQMESLLDGLIRAQKKYDVEAREQQRIFDTENSETVKFTRRVKDLELAENCYDDLDLKDLTGKIEEAQNVLADLTTDQRVQGQKAALKQRWKSAQEMLDVMRGTGKLPPQEADSSICAKCPLFESNPEEEKRFEDEIEKCKQGLADLPQSDIVSDTVQAEDIRRTDLFIRTTQRQIASAHEREKDIADLDNCRKLLDNAKTARDRATRKMDQLLGSLMADKKEDEVEVDKLHKRLDDNLGVQVQDRTNELDIIKGKGAETLRQYLELGNQIAVMEQVLKETEDKLRDIEEMEKSVKERKDNAFEWSFLSDVCGRNKLQALELDAAAPAISDLSNQLLSRCFGGRFTMHFRTLDENEREVFDVVVHDSIGDSLEQVPLHLTSGGEQVLLLHALRLAMTLHAKTKSGRDFRTIFVDEIDGQLHKSVRHEFADMNREALKEGEFETMFLVSHSNEVIDSADRLIEFEQGVVSII